MPTFNILFSGRLKEGYVRNEVVKNLGLLFKVDSEKLEKKIFTNSPVVLKKGLTLEQAKKYEKAMFETGIIVAISPQEPASSRNFSTEIKVKSIDAKLAAPGAILVEPNSEKKIDYDTSQFSLSEVGVILVEPIVVDTPRYDLSKFAIKKLDE